MADPVGNGQDDPDSQEIEEQSRGRRKQVSCRHLQYQQRKENGETFQHVKQQQHSRSQQGVLRGTG